MDLWKMAIEGKKPQTRVLQSISRGCVVTPKEPPKRGQILDRRTTTKLEDEIDDVVDQMNQRLQIKPPPAVNDASVNVMDSIYDKYNFKRRYNENSQLPIYAERDEILSSIEKNQTVVIEGSTGCGKSTQVPQMILDDAYAKRRHCNIIVTQPRRIAAKSLAQRVSDERDWDLGTVVGYQIGLDKRYISDETAITYCTTGILLEKLLQSKSLKSYTHIILDEVHERNKDLDFLFIIIRWLLSQTGQPRTTKIVLMSATLQTERFSDYFKFYDDKWRNAPVITLRKESLYTVNCFYLEDLDIELGHVTTHWDKPGISADMYQIARSLVRKIGYLESEENEMSGCDTLGSILIFLPGIFEIGRLYNMLTEYSAKSNDVKWNCLILHSMLSMDEQRLIFQPSEEGWRKIILSTNIAESSITVPDVRYVIDFCLTKYLSTNRVNNFTSLDMDWASKSSLQQRAGRAGRVQHGRCFRMIPKKYFTTYFREFSIPELLLTPLENVVLKAKEFQVEKPHIIIGMAMDPPKMPDIATTILILKELGALLPEVRGEGYSDIDGDLTFLGKMMSSLPLDVRATRLIAIGYCFGLLEECIIMAACLTSRSIFEVSFDRNISTYNRRLEWSNGSGCDLIAMMNAYKIWHLKHNLKEFSMSGDGRRREREFCRKHHLDSRSLQECHLLKQELQERLLKLGLHEIQGVHRIRWTDSQKIIILKVVISGAFYPNVFTTDTSNNPMNEHQICHALNGRDPTRTVFFSGFPKNTTRQLYVKAIKNLFRGSVVDDTDMDNVKISFDDDSEKVFVTFDMERGCNDEIAHWESTRSSIPGRIASEVYKSVKMRQARIPMHIPLLPPMHEQHLVEECGLKLPPGREPVFKSPLEDDAQYLCMPGILADEAIGRITHIETCSKFWFQPQSEDETVASYKDELNVENPKHELFDSITLNELKKINKADIIAAQSKHDNQFYRVSLLRWHFDNANNAYICVVRLIDTGEIQHLTLKELFKFKAMIPQSVRPPRCYQCCLAEVKPSLMNISGGNLWDRAASQFMEDFTAGKTVKTEIFSVVNAIVYVKVFVGDRCLNDELVKEKLAEVCEESYLSKTNHYKRRSAIKSAKFNVNAEEAEELNIPDEYYPIVEFEPIDMVDCRSSHKTIKLNGPKSPLEIDVYSANSENGVKNIHMDANSVNSVLLAAPEDDSMMKYVVAAHMSQKGGEDKYYALHQTTLLPNIRGFGILMAMIFSPRMHLKRDKAKTRFTSVLTGLGFVKDRPIFPQHDNVFYLDFALDEDDLNLINQIRYSIDTMLYAHDDATKKEISTIKSSLEIMKKIKEVVEKLLRKERPPMDMVVESHEWSEYEKIDVLQKTDIYKGRSIFPIQNSLKLYPMAAEVMDSLKAHCDDLYNRVDYLRGETNCRLCSVHIENITILRIHLMTRLHKEREKMIGLSRSLF